MAIAYDIGFTQKTELSDIVKFLESKGFILEQPIKSHGKIIPVMSYTDPKEFMNYVEFFYYENPHEYKCFFGKRSKDIKAYAELKTFSYDSPIHEMTSEQRSAFIKNNKIITEYDKFKKLYPERLLYYETALAFKEKFSAIVLYESVQWEIDPNRVLYTDSGYCVTTN